MKYMKIDHSGTRCCWHGRILLVLAGYVDLLYELIVLKHAKIQVPRATIRCPKEVNIRR